MGEVNFREQVAKLESKLERQEAAVNETKAMLEFLRKQMELPIPGKPAGSR